MKHLFSLRSFMWVTGLVCLTAATIPVSAQRKQATVSPDDYIFWGAPAAYLNYQAKVAYPLINRMLEAYPPQKEIGHHRQMALVALDQFLHEADYQRRDGFYTFVNDRMVSMLNGIDPTVQSGVRICKLYNGGFLLKTPKTTVGINIVSGGTKYKPFLTDSIIYELADRCDALIVTGSDSRHANRDVANAFIFKGKKVIVPQGLWSNLEEENVLSFGKDSTETIETGGMRLHVLPGNASNNWDNVLIMDFSGSGVVAYAYAHDMAADWSWIDNIHDRYNIDVLLTKSQNTNLETMLRGFQPHLVITSHENEMESGVDRRESYWATQKRMLGLAELGIPNVVMAWGEVYDTTGTLSSSGSSSASKKLINGVLYIERDGSVYTPAGIKVK